MILVNNAWRWKTQKQQLLSDKRRDKEIKRLKKIISTQETTIIKLRKEIERKNLQIITLLFKTTKKRRSD